MKIEAKDGTDYLYKKHGKNWRVRVRINSELPTDAPVNGDVEIESAGVGLSVSVAALDENNNVSADPLGRFRIFPAHVVTIQNFKDVDPEAIIEETIQKQIDEANDQLVGKDNLYKVLDKYK